MTNRIEQSYKSELLQIRHQDNQRKKAIKTKNPFSKNSAFKKFEILIPLGGEAVSGGILPCCTGYVIYAYRKEKKSGGSPNLAEYLVFGGLSAGADAIGLLGLTGVLLILSYGVTVPCLGLLWLWRIYKGAK